MAITWTTSQVDHTNRVGCLEWDTSGHIGTHWDWDWYNWVTLHQVLYGLFATNLHYEAISVYHQYDWNYNDETKEFGYTSGYIHEALMVNLEPGKIHFYKVRAGMNKFILWHGSAEYLTQSLKISDWKSLVQYYGQAVHCRASFQGYLKSFNCSNRGCWCFWVNFDTSINLGKQIQVTWSLMLCRSSVMVTDNIMRNMKKRDFHGVIHCGDIAYADGYKGVEQRWGKQVRTSLWNSK